MPPKGSKKGVAPKVASVKMTVSSKKSATTVVNTDSTNDIGNLSICPAEIVLNIFSHFDYFDVKRCLMVCKGFQVYCNHPVLDDLMFRNIAALAPGTKFDPENVERHFCLDDMSYECSTHIEGAYLHGNSEVDSIYSDHDTYPLVKTSAINEYATMPAMGRIKIKIQSMRPVEVKNDSGVTVHDVLKALVKFFSTGSHRDNMGDYTGWTGFDRQLVDKNGVLVLLSDYFDS